MKPQDKSTRLDYLKKFYTTIQRSSSLADRIPQDIDRDYKPSGKVEILTIPIMLLMSLIGGLLGYLIHLALHWVSIKIMQLFHESGGCLSILLFPAAIIFVLSPILIPTFAALMTHATAEFSKCRNISVALLLGGIIGYVTGLEIVEISNNLVGSEPLYDFFEDMKQVDPKDHPIEYIITGLIGILFESLGSLWSFLLGIAGFIIAVSIITPTARHPFCEKTNASMKDRIVKRMPLENLQYLLFFLFEKNPIYLTHITYLEERSDWDNISRIDLIYWTSEGNVSNLLEVNVFYPKKDSAKDTKSRLVFSEMVSVEDMQFFSQALSYSL